MGAPGSELSMINKRADDFSDESSEEESLKSDWTEHRHPEGEERNRTEQDRHN